MKGSVKSREDLSFEYTSDQWRKLSRLLEKQYATYQWTYSDLVNGDILRDIAFGGGDDFYLTSLYFIRRVLECAASDFHFEHYRAPARKADSKANQAEAEKIIRCCDFIVSALSNDRDGSISRSRRRLNIDGGIQELRKEAESVLRFSSYDAPTNKHRRHDRLRGEYLNRLCHFWVTLGGKPTTSFDHRKGKGSGEATGDFVDFILLAAKPVVSGMTAHGARGAIEKWRKRYLSELPVVIGRGPPYPPGAVMYQEPPEVWVAGGQRLNLSPSEGWYYLPPPPPPGYARLKNRRPRK